MKIFSCSKLFLCKSYMLVLYLMMIGKHHKPCLDYILFWYCYCNFPSSFVPFSFSLCTNYKLTSILTTISYRIQFACSTFSIGSISVHQCLKWKKHKRSQRRVILNLQFSMLASQKVDNLLSQLSVGFTRWGLNTDNQPVCFVNQPLCFSIKCGLWGSCYLA